MKRANRMSAVAMATMVAVVLTLSAVSSAQAAWVATKYLDLNVRDRGNVRQRTLYTDEALNVRVRTQSLPNMIGNFFQKTLWVAKVSVSNRAQ